MPRQETMFNDEFANKLISLGQEIDPSKIPQVPEQGWFGPGDTDGTPDNAGEPLPPASNVSSQGQQNQKDYALAYKLVKILSPQYVAKKHKVRNTQQNQNVSHQTSNPMQIKTYPFPRNMISMTAMQIFGSDVMKEAAGLGLDQYYVRDNTSRISDAFKELVDVANKPSFYFDLDADESKIIASLEQQFSGRMKTPNSMTIYDKARASVRAANDAVGASVALLEHLLPNNSTDPDTVKEQVAYGKKLSSALKAAEYNLTNMIKRR